MAVFAQFGDRCWMSSEDVTGNNKVANSASHHNAKQQPNVVRHDSQHEKIADQNLYHVQNGLQHVVP